MNFPLGQIDVYPGYQSIVFLHDNGIFSTVIARSSDDRALAALRLPEVFDAAARAIPALAAWTDPTRAHPYTPVLPGGRLHNTYQGQLDDTGAVPCPAWCSSATPCAPPTPPSVAASPPRCCRPASCCACSTTTPTTSPALTLAFDAWCTDNIAPWFDDHVYWDAELVRRWAGADVDLTRPLPSDLIVAATAGRPLAVPPRRALPRHARPAGQPRPRTTPSHRDLRQRLASAGTRRPHPRRACRPGRRTRRHGCGVVTQRRLGPASRLRPGRRQGPDTPFQPPAGA